MIKKTLFVLLAMSLMMAACAPVVKTSEPRRGDGQTH